MRYLLPFVFLSVASATCAAGKLTPFPDPRYSVEIPEGWATTPAEDGTLKGLGPDGVTFRAAPNDSPETVEAVLADYLETYQAKPGYALVEKGSVKTADRRGGEVAVCDYDAKKGRTRVVTACFPGVDGQMMIFIWGGPAQAVQAQKPAIVSTFTSFKVNAPAGFADAPAPAGKLVGSGGSISGSIGSGRSGASASNVADAASVPQSSDRVALPDARYSVVLPAGWTKEPADPNPGRGSGKLKGMGPGKIAFTVVPVKTAESPEAALKLYLDGISKRPGYELLQEGDETTKDGRAGRLAVSGSAVGAERVGTVAVCFPGAPGEVVLFSFTGPQKSFEDEPQQRAVKQMFKSLLVTP